MSNNWWPTPEQLRQGTIACYHETLIIEFACIGKVAPSLEVIEELARRSAKDVLWVIQRMRATRDTQL